MNRFSTSGWATEPASEQEAARLPTTCPFVFNRGGKPIRHFYNSWRNACEKAGVAGKLRHDFRRTAREDANGSKLTRTVS